MSDGFLRIGPFSRACSLSVKALRAYHEQGILVPAAVDPASGYRVYGSSQLLDATVLRRLRELDVPLRQVREVLEARDPVVTERVLAEHTRVMQQRLDDTLRIIDGLQRGVDAPGLHTPVHVREEPASHALMVDGRIDAATTFPAFLGEAFGRLAAAVSASGATRVGFDGLLCEQQIDDDLGEDVVAYVPIAAPVDVTGVAGVRVGEVPESSVAVATHVGGYDEISDTYLSLGRWVATHAVPRSLPVRERYVVAPPADPIDLCTEIHWPVDRPA